MTALSWCRCMKPWQDGSPTVATLQAAARLGRIVVWSGSSGPSRMEGVRSARGSDPQGGCPDRSARLHSQVSRPVHGHQAGRLGDGGARGAAGAAGRHRLHADRRHASRGGPRRRQGDHARDGASGPASRVSCQGRRYTDDATLEIVARVLAEEINADIVGHISKYGGRAAGLHHKTSQCLFGRRLTLRRRPGQRDRPGPRRRGDARSIRRRSRTSASPESSRCSPRSPADLDERGPPPERQRRHRRRRRRPGAAGREARLPHRHAGHPPRPERTRQPDPGSDPRRLPAS